MDEPEFQRDLYRGTAQDYDRFRVPYPQTLIADLLRWCKATGQGRLLDLACGTGQIAFAMHPAFDEAWAVDQEPDMVAFAQEKARAAGIRNIRFLVAPAEELVAPAASFELIAVGNGFHRLRRDAVAASAFRWLKPGGCLALLWSSSPWQGPATWQQALAATLERWQRALATEARVPQGWEQARQQRPDRTVLEAAGFAALGSHRFPTPYAWTAEALAGFAYSTSFLPRAQVGGRAAEFEEDLRRALEAAEPGGRFSQTIDFACELVRRPG